MMWGWQPRHPALLIASLIIIAMACILLVGCGANTTTPSQFREDCEKNGGTFVDTNSRNESCIYNKEQP